MAAYSIGVDLGGTNLRAAAIDEGGRIIEKIAGSTDLSSGRDAVIDDIVANIVRLREKFGASDLAGVGIGVPGFILIEKGVILGSHNMPGFEDYPARDEIERRLGAPVVLENDANAAALGEFLLGSGRGTSIMALLTLGTGLGSGIVIDGKLLHGAHGIGAELGHIIVEPGGEQCGCGQRGCLERYASATYLAQYARRLIEQDRRESSLAEVLATTGQLDAKDVQQAAGEGDKLAREVWDRAVEYLAVGCVNLCRVLDPDVIVLGGGMAKAGENLLEPLGRHFRRLHWEISPPRTALVLGDLGNDAGVIGAAGAAWENFRS